MQISGGRWSASHKLLYYDYPLFASNYIILHRIEYHVKHPYFSVSICCVFVKLNLSLSLNFVILCLFLVMHNHISLPCNMPWQMQTFQSRRVWWIVTASLTRVVLVCLSLHSLFQENVEGHRCDRCKANTFGMSVRNPLGCSKCYCYGITQSCVEAQGLIRMWVSWTFVISAPRRTSKYLQTIVWRCSSFFLSLSVTLGTF